MGRAKLAASILLILLTAALAAAQQPDEVPLADVLEVLVLDRQLVAIDARGGGQRELALRLEERVLWTGARGRVGVALTDQRVLAVAVGSAAWQEADRQLDEELPGEALLGDRVALVVTSRRILGFDGGSGNLVESRLGVRERVLALRTGENVAVAVTDRRALGLSPMVGGFFEAKLSLVERFESLTAAANLATVTTDRRVLIFRAPSGSWEQRLRTLR
jgi:hypothetical protein